MLAIDLPTARRYILGRQGLWPGRRWRGAGGVEHAMRAVEYLQLDPLQIVARSQDLMIHSRVLESEPGAWEKAAYDQRGFFDWGSWLAVRPMDELPHWRVVMRRFTEQSQRFRELEKEHGDAIREMRDVLRERGTVSNRDFDMKDRKRTESYRGRKDSALALYYLWFKGEVMTHHRERFERVYALTEDVAPAALIRQSRDEAADAFLFAKEVRFHGLTRLKRVADSFYRGVPFDRVPGMRESMLENGLIVEVQVEGWKEPHVAIAEDVPLLQDLAAGRVPSPWTPIGTCTTEEAVFLAPLDPVSARGRASILFGFDYVWEVYKPEAKRRFGYYVLPVLWGDRLVARFDSRLDRSTNTLRVLGFWLEEVALGANAEFAEALQRGFGRFLQFLGAKTLDGKAIQEPLLRKAVQSARP